MKQSFFGYYPPTEAEYERLWNEATIVLDTNVLLNLYRLPTTARDELLAVLETLKDRLWIPHHVALEFHRRRLTVIAAERKSTEDALKTSSDLVAELKKKVDNLQIDKRGIGVEPQPLLDDLEKANSKLIDAIKAAHSSQLDISSSDSVREKLNDLLYAKVGVGPKTQKELDELSEGGDDRFKEKIPPGFADAEKDKNPNEATFVHDHLKYPRKFGDLILWRQLLNHAKAAALKVVLFVTADRKEDWWWKEQGKTIGPHPELVREIIRDSGVELYWMYSSVQFVEHANKYTAATVSSAAVDELKQVSIAHRTTFEDRESMNLQMESLVRMSRSIGEYRYSERPDPRLLEDAVADWLLQRHENIRRNFQSFPDFVTSDCGDVHGFEVKFVRSFGERMVVSPSVVNSLLRGYLEKCEGRLSEFTLIAVIPDEEFFSIVNSERSYELEARLARLLGKYPVSGIVVGAVLNGRFEPLVYQRDRTFDTD